MYKRGLEHADGVYRVRKIVNGRVRKGTFPTRRAALLFIERLSLERVGLALGGALPTLSEGIDSYLRECRLANRSDLTIRYYEIKRVALERGLGDLPIHRIGQAEIDRYTEARLIEVSGGTINKELAFLRSVYKHLEIPLQWRYRALSHHPGRRRVYTVNLVRELLQGLSGPSACAVGLCLLAGIRAAEAWRAEASWVRGEHLDVYVRKNGGDVNTTYLVPTLRAMLPASGKLVRKHEAAVRYEIEQVSKRVGFNPPVKGPGAFRHACATYASELGCSRDDIKLVLGHRYGDVTDRYLHSQQVERKRAVLERVEGYVWGTVGGEKCPNVAGGGVVGDRAESQ
jgi:integrase